MNSKILDNSQRGVSMKLGLSTVSEQPKDQTAKQLRMISVAVYNHAVHTRNCLTRKGYYQLAAIMASMFPDNIDDTIVNFAYMLGEMNANFNEDKFMDEVRKCVNLIPKE